MALQNPNWLQAGTYTAAQDRLNQQAVLNTAGVIGAGSLAVTAQASPNMTVNIAAGWGAIVPTTAGLGVYGIYNDATVVQTISAANATNPRIDLIVATINDAQYSGSANNVGFTTVAGTPAASPTVPTTPNNSIVLAQIAVAAATTTITTANITDRRSPVTNNLNGASYYIQQSAYSPSVSATPQIALAASGSSVTLTASTTYEVEVALRVTGTVGSTPTTLKTRLDYSGTAVLPPLLTYISGISTAGYAPTQTVSYYQAQIQEDVSILTTASNTFYGMILIKGLVTTTTAGTMTPKVSFSSTTGVTGLSVQKGYIKATPIAPASITTFGAWS